MAEETARARRTTKKPAWLLDNVDPAALPDPEGELKAPPPPRPQHRRAPAADGPHSHARAAGAAAAAAAAAAARGERPRPLDGPRRVCMNPSCKNPFDSPQWRRGPLGPGTLCNACGTRYARIEAKKKGERRGARVRAEELTEWQVFEQQLQRPPEPRVPWQAHAVVGGQPLGGLQFGAQRQQQQQARPRQQQHRQQHRQAPPSPPSYYGADHQGEAHEAAYPGRPLEAGSDADFFPQPAAAQRHQRRHLQQQLQQLQELERLDAGARAPDDGLFCEEGGLADDDLHGGLAAAAAAAATGRPPAPWDPPAGAPRPLSAAARAALQQQLDSAHLLAACGGSPPCGDDPECDNSPGARPWPGRRGRGSRQRCDDEPSDSQEAAACSYHDPAAGGGAGGAAAAAVTSGAGRGRGGAEPMGPGDTFLHLLAVGEAMIKTEGVGQEDRREAWAEYVEKRLPTEQQPQQPQHGADGPRAGTPVGAKRPRSALDAEQPASSEPAPPARDRFERLLAEAEQCIRARSASPLLRPLTPQWDVGGGGPAAPSSRAQQRPSSAGPCGGSAPAAGRAGSRSPVPRSSRLGDAARQSSNAGAPPPLVLPPAATAAPTAAGRQQPIAGGLLLRGTSGGGAAAAAAAGTSAGRGQPFEQGDHGRCAAGAFMMADAQLLTDEQLSPAPLRSHPEALFAPPQPRQQQQQQLRSWPAPRAQQEPSAVAAAVAAAAAAQASRQPPLDADALRGYIREVLANPTATTLLIRCLRMVPGLHQQLRQRLDEEKRQRQQERQRQRQRQQEQQEQQQSPLALLLQRVAQPQEEQQQQQGGSFAALMPALATALSGAPGGASNSSSSSDAAAMRCEQPSPTKPERQGALP